MNIFGSWLILFGIIGLVIIVPFACWQQAKLNRSHEPPRRREELRDPYGDLCYDDDFMCKDEYKP
jgi:hypothetical protein